ncbi:MAG TPA: hypothetical protein VFA89_11415 [Terriglobales bacterium]|nr:hypothetical protein [Terriglobales bacterium]
MTSNKEQDFERWKKRGEVLGKAKSGNQWAIADWIRDGMKRFKKSDVYDEVEELTGMTRASLQQFKLTAEFFPTISTRVKNLSFGHHRLVAKKIFTKAKRKELLRRALTHKPKKLTVVQFADVVAKECGRIAVLEKANERMTNTPTNSDQAAQKVVELCKQFCKDFSSHLSVRALMHSDPPGDRRQVIRELKATAEEFNRMAKELEFHWQDYDVGHYYKQERADASAAGRL